MFTAARIAFWLGRTAQAVRKGLRAVPPTSARIVNGQEADVWEFSQLPESWRFELATKAKKLRFLNAETMLANSAAKWEPALPLDKMAETEIEHAQKVREALLPWLKRRDDLSLSAGEFVRLGAEEYRRVVGEGITGRWWRMLLERTIHRDGGLENFNRLALYVSERPAQKRSQAEIVSRVLEKEFSQLCSFFELLPNPAKLSHADAKAVWRRTFEEYDAMIASGTEPKRAARRLRDLLVVKVPGLAPTRNALLASFGRKLERWLENHDSGALEDQRQHNGDSFEIPEADLVSIGGLIVFQYGEFDPAWKHAWRMGKLSEKTRQRYIENGGRYCPKKFKAVLGQKPRLAYMLNRRKRDFNSAKAHFDMDYSGLYSLDCITADDVTGPVYFWYKPEGGGKPIVTRGQCLVFEDVVSRRILGWCLLPEKNYNALAIYTTMARVMREHGNPRALLFEKGIWHKSKIITGSKGEHSMLEVTEGLKSFGIEFFHAHTPEGKTEIENTMGRIQDLMEGEPGYAGRDERKDCPDWTKKQLSEVAKASGPHPSKYFHSFEELNNRLAEIFQKYNDLPQHGKHNTGKSPNQVWEERWNLSDPPSKFPDELAYQLSHAKYEKAVGADGFSITSGKRTFKYFGPELASLVGFRVLVWFNPELPERAYVTTMNRKFITGVPLHNGVPRLERLTNPDGGILAEACERREGQVAGIVAYYNTLKSKVELPYRKNVIPAQQVELGERMRADAEKAEARESQARAHVTKSRKLATELDVPENWANNPQKLRLAERVRAARAQAEQETSKENQ